MHNSQQQKRKGSHSFLPFHTHTTLESSKQRLYCPKKTKIYLPPVQLITHKSNDNHFTNIFLNLVCNAGSDDQTAILT